MMAAILKFAILDSDTAILESDTLLSSLRFTQKHSHSTLTLIQTNSIWLKLIHSYLTWWCQPSWNLPSWIQPFWTKKKTSLIHSDPTLWWQSSWILPSWIQPFRTKKKYTHSFWLNLMMSDIYNSAILVSTILNKKKLHSFILTQLDDGSHLKLFHVGMQHCHLGFRHLVIFSQIHSKTLSHHSHSDSN